MIHCSICGVAILNDNPPCYGDKFYCEVCHQERLVRRDGLIVTKLVFVKISANILEGSLLMPKEKESQLKDVLLNRLGIAKETSETHLQAWLRHLAEINHYPVQTPAFPALSDAIKASPEALRFMLVIS